MTDFEYPTGSLDGGKKTIKWIHGLSKSEIHRVLIDKNLPESIMEDLCRELPFQYLQNFACNRKVPSRIRIMVLRRAFRAKEVDLKNDKKIQLFSVVMGLKFISKKEKQAARSYIQEIQESKTREKKKLKRKFVKRDKNKTPDRAQYNLSRVKIKESTKGEIFSILINLAISSQLEEYEHNLQVFQARVNALWPVHLRDTGKESLLIDSRLVMLYLQLADKALTIPNKLRMESIQKTLENRTRGTVKDALLANFHDQGNANKTVCEMLIWLTSDDREIISSIESTLLEFSKKYPILLDNLQEKVSLLKVENVSNRKVEIEIETDLFVDMQNSKLLYWKSDVETELDAFSENFVQSYCPFNNRRRYTASLNYLSKDSEYRFRVEIPNSKANFVNLIHSFVSKKDEPLQIYEPWKGYSSGHSIQDYIVPPGGGGERRRQQF